MKRAINNKKGFTSYKNQRFSKGFTLIEIAIVLIIIGAFISFGVGMIGVLFKGNRLNETRQVVKSAKDALKGFALKHTRFPCPDTNGDGVEDCTYSPSSPYKNTRLPYVTLGMKGKDPYLNQLYYDVNNRTVNGKTLTSLTSSGYDLCTTLKNITTGDDPRITQNAGSNYSSVAAIVLSSSENMSLDPSINSSSTRDYETKGITEDFDDIVDWIDPSSLLAKLGCQANCSSYTVYNSTVSTVEVKGGIYGGCKSLSDGDMFNVRSGDTVKVYSAATCPGGTPINLAVTYTASQTVDTDEDCAIQGTNFLTFVLSDY